MPITPATTTTPANRIAGPIELPAPLSEVDTHIRSMFSPQISNRAIYGDWSLPMAMRFLTQLSKFEPSTSSGDTTGSPSLAGVPCQLVRGEWASREEPIGRCLSSYPLSSSMHGFVGSVTFIGTERTEIRMNRTTISAPLPRIALTPIEDAARTGLSRTRIFEVLRDGTLVGHRHE